MDTTGTVWPERQRFIHNLGFDTKQSDIDSDKPFGMNWKMTAKTILVQLHHKIKTFEAIHKHLVLVAQDCLLNYMRKEFTFSHLNDARSEDPLHFHSYSFVQKRGTYSLSLAERFSTDGEGAASALNLNANAHVGLDKMIKLLEEKICTETLFSPV